MDSTLLPPPTCPRCGYDLSGACAVRGQSPTGTCSECGLVYQWSDVLDPEHGIPAWFMERRRIRWYAVFGTWIRALLAPGRFWRTIRMHFPIRAARLIVFALLALLGLHLGAGVIPILALSGWPAMQSWSVWYTPQLSEYLGLLVNPYSAELGQMWLNSGRGLITFEAPRTFDLSMLIAAGFVFLMPLTPVLLRQTLRRFRVRSAHIWRVWVYSLAMLPVMAVLHGYAVVFTVLSGWGPPGGAFGGGITGTMLGTVLGSLQSIAPLRIWCLGLDLIWACLVWYWGLARYLRLPHAAAIVAGGAIISSLIVTIVTMLAFSYTFFEMFAR